MKITRKLIHFLRLRRNRSTVPTGLVPLSGLHSAVIFLENPGDISEPQKVSVATFFKQHGIGISWLHSEDEELRSSSDLFISLALSGDIFERYAASCSSARFKVGRHQLKGDVYDFVMTDNATEPVPAMEACGVIEQYLLNIK
ncbi:MAG: hypothetical protein IKZ51_06285 [Bacteroidales bacterium]|nr:hypothetical protein [Bacteroidales bacterium]